MILNCNIYIPKIKELHLEQSVYLEQNGELCLKTVTGIGPLGLVYLNGLQSSIDEIKLTTVTHNQIINELDASYFELNDFYKVGNLKIYQDCKTKFTVVFESNYLKIHCKNINELKNFVKVLKK